MFSVFFSPAQGRVRMTESELQEDNYDSKELQSLQHIDQCSDQLHEIPRHQNRLPESLNGMSHIMFLQKAEIEVE